MAGIVNVRKSKHKPSEKMAHRWESGAEVEPLVVHNCQFVDAAPLVLCESFDQMGSPQNVRRGGHESAQELLAWWDALSKINDAGKLRGHWRSF